MNGSSLELSGLVKKMSELDYSQVNQYWDKATTSVLGPYMMDGFGFPTGAGRFRFLAESKIVERLIEGANRKGGVLDLGSGIGYWALYFSKNFENVTAVEGSKSLYKAMKARCASYSNIKLIYGDVLSFKPKRKYALIFLGGMLMYLNKKDVIRLLRKIRRFLEPGGIILCRESTVDRGSVTRRDDYQVVYRSVPTYKQLFKESGLSINHVEANAPYILMQMGCEFVKKWKELVPQQIQMIPVVGSIVYWGLRLGNPWITQVPRIFHTNFPILKNHFFVLNTA